MSTAHFDHWPPGLGRHLTLPATSLVYNLEVSARRYPDKPMTLFYGSALTYGQAWAQVQALAGHLQQRCGVTRGDRVLLDLQNSPQWIVACFAILRADAVVVPVNPMNRREELRHLVEDTGARVAVCGQDLADELLPVLGDDGLRHLVVACYADALDAAPTDLRLPDIVRAPRRRFDTPGVLHWHEALHSGCEPAPHSAGPDDLAIMPYTSGTTGKPKGCMHTHRSVMSTLVGGVVWFGRNQDAVYLSVLPFFHVTGLSGSLLGPVYLGATMVVLSRWDREVAARCIERHRVTVWQAISTMVVDFLAQPGAADLDLSSLQGVRGGGAAMPEAVAAQLKALTGLEYVEGYGMSETLAATHINPTHRPKRQCLGIPVFDVDARLVDPATLQPLPPGDPDAVGEIVVHAPQVMQGYWRAEQATAEAFVELDGRRFLRTGDLARIDEDGYFFMVDRLKRMINASGYKVWPAEVEAMLYAHPAIQEACVIAAQDAKRGETVKALVVLRAGHALAEQELIEWAHGRMAAYKCPRIVRFVDSLPKSGSGKVQWRELQQQEAAAPAG
ncbi:long-chain fatty acid--CoA ligase [Aquabacterium sp. J223]|uniref:long-chain fatty acid--CoA ligase n=1 Tax=Aquabacterium sp. J223 TaxID=2898431 RepID=UPI0021AD753D|nr:long-chain fatty acid--CoA ligase [Aquabacterium sp. J223]UUX95880.1 long-chain fatty acid--CoA ligase [Aquabacterium sp. J223]